MGLFDDLVPEQDYASRYNTALSTQDEDAYRQWIARQNAALGRDIGADTADYDMRGAFKAGVNPAENGHFPDTFKKPNHPTFSDQSQYHGVDGNQGGSWMNVDGKWHFTPGKTNLDTHGEQGLRDYMQRGDPNVQLDIPPTPGMFDDLIPQSGEEPGAQAQGAFGPRAASAPPTWRRRGQDVPLQGAPTEEPSWWPQQLRTGLETAYSNIMGTSLSGALNEADRMERIRDGKELPIYDPVGRSTDSLAGFENLPAEEQNAMIAKFRTGAGDAFTAARRSREFVAGAPRDPGIQPFTDAKGMDKLWALADPGVLGSVAQDAFVTGAPSMALPTALSLIPGVGPIAAGVGHAGQQYGGRFQDVITAEMTKDKVDLRNQDAVQAWFQTNPAKINDAKNKALGAAGVEGLGTTAMFGLNKVLPATSLSTAVLQGIGGAGLASLGGIGADYVANGTVDFDQHGTGFIANLPLAIGLSVLGMRSQPQTSLKWNPNWTGDLQRDFPAPPGTPQIGTAPELPPRPIVPTPAPPVPAPPEPAPPVARPGVLDTSGYAPPPPSALALPAPPRAIAGPAPAPEAPIAAPGGTIALPPPTGGSDATGYQPTPGAGTGGTGGAIPPPTDLTTPAPPGGVTPPPTTLAGQQPLPGQGQGQGQAGTPTPGSQSQGEDATTIVPAPAGVTANEAITPTGKRVPVQYEMVHIDNLVPATGDLQPRDRGTRIGSEDQINKIKAEFDPAQVILGPYAERGPPIIGPDGVIEGGNGRTEAMRQLLQEAAAGDEHAITKMDDYYAALRAAGYNPKYGEILIRRRQGDLTPEQRRDLASDLNAPTGLVQSEPEVARSDVRHITPEMLARYDPARPGDFAKEFVSKLPANERGGVMDAAGNLSNAGARRVRNALLARAYDNPVILDRYVDSQNPDMKGFGNALVDASAPWAQMRDAVKAGTVAPGMDITNDLVRAMDVTRAAREGGIEASHALAQAQNDMLDKLSPAGAELMRALYNPKMTRLAAAEKVAQILKDYARLAMEQRSAATDMFGGGTKTAEQLLKEARTKIQSQPETGEGQGDLLTGKKPAPEPVGRVAPPTTEIDEGKAALLREHIAEVDQQIAVLEHTIEARKDVIETAKGRAVGAKGKAKKTADETVARETGFLTKNEKALAELKAERAELQAELDTGPPVPTTQEKLDKVNRQIDTTEGTIKMIERELVRHEKQAASADIGKWKTQAEADVATDKAALERLNKDLARYTSQRDDLMRQLGQTPPTPAPKAPAPKAPAPPAPTGEDTVTANNRAYLTHQLTQSANAIATRERANAGLERLIADQRAELEAGDKLNAKQVEQLGQWIASNVASLEKGERELKSLRVQQKKLAKELEELGPAPPPPEPVATPAKKATRKKTLNDQEVADAVDEMGAPIEPVDDAAEVMHEHALVDETLAAMDDPTQTGSSYTNRTSIQMHAFTDAGVDPHEAVLWPAAKQIRVLSKMLVKNYGFKEVRVVPVKTKRGDRVNLAYITDQMLDAYANMQWGMHAILLSKESASLYGRVTLEFGGRANTNSPLGTYAPGTRTIRINDRANSFAHEWIHALDHLLIESLGSGLGTTQMASRRILTRGPGNAANLNTDTNEEFSKLLTLLFTNNNAGLAVQMFGLQQKAAEVGPTGRPTKAALQATKDIQTLINNHKSGMVRGASRFAPADYWTDPAEMLARSGEAWIGHNMQNMGIWHNEFVSKGDRAYLTKSDQALRALYPKDTERNAQLAQWNALRDAFLRDMILGGGKVGGAPRGSTNADILNPENWKGGHPPTRDAGVIALLRRGANFTFRDARWIYGAITAPRDFGRQVAENMGWDIDNSSNKNIVPRMEKFQDATHRFIGGSIGGRMSAIVARQKASPAARELMNRIQDDWDTQPGRQRLIKRSPYEEAREMASYQFQNRLFAALHDNGLADMKPDENAMLWRMLTDQRLGTDRPSPEMVRAAGEIRPLLKSGYYYGKNAGLDIGYQDTYMPRGYIREKILRDPVKFVRQATLAYGDQFDKILEPHTTDPARQAAMRDLAKETGISVPRGTIDEAALRADYAKLKAERWNNRVRVGDPDSFDALGPDTSFLQERELPASADSHLAEFMNTDVRDVLSDYFHKLAARAEYVRRAGRANARLEAMFTAVERAGGLPEDIRQMRHLIQLVSGRTAANQLTDPVLSAESAIMYYGTVGLMTRSAFSSMFEPINSVLRTRSMRALIANLNGLVQDAVRSTSGMERRDLAYAAGWVLSQQTENLMLSRLNAEIGFHKTRGRKLSTYFMRNILGPMTRWQQMGAVAGAESFVRQLVNNAEGATGERKQFAIRRLKELGVPPNLVTELHTFLNDPARIGGLKADDVSGLTATAEGKMIGTAIGRVRRQTVLAADRIDKPELAMAPGFRMLFGLQSFNLAFARQMLARLYQEIKNTPGFGAKLRNGLSMVMSITAVLAFSYISLAFKKALFGADNPNATDEEKMNQFLWQGWSQAGGFGAFDPLVQAVAGIYYNRSFTQILAPSQLGQIINPVEMLLKSFIQNSDNTNTSERNRVKAIMQMAAPLMGSLLVAIPGAGLATTAGVMFGTSAAARDLAATALYGPQTQRRGMHKPGDPGYRPPRPRRGSGSGGRFAF